MTRPPCPPTFLYFRPDEVAECWEPMPPELYQALWASMEGMPSIASQIEIEESCPQDAIGLNTLASVWDKFTPNQQDLLIVLEWING